MTRTRFTIRNELAGWYLARNRLKEAMAVLREDLPGDELRPEFHERRARVASWLSMAQIEADSLERLVALRESRDARRRLVALWPFLGEPERAVPHAIKIAEEVGELAEIERAAILAFSSGVPDEGFALLERIADGAANEAFWRVKIADYAEQDPFASTRRRVHSRSRMAWLRRTSSRSGSRRSTDGAAAITLWPCCSRHGSTETHET